MKRVEDYIAVHRLLDKSRLQLVALSGGADSVCLLLMLSELGYRVEAIHCNFNLRGEESLRDEAFCRSLCQRKDIPFHVVHFDTRFYAHQHKVSIEMAARELRYRHFASLRRDLQAEAVCVAHHADDNAETLLINLVRGTGIHGLCAMRPRNGHVVRPLLCCRRTEILDWLSQRGEPFVTDSTNLADDATRNRVRHHLIPLLEQFNPSVVDGLNRTAEHLTQVAGLCDDVLDRESRRVLRASQPAPHSPLNIDIRALEQSPSPSLLLFHILHPMGFNSRQVDQIAQQLHATPGSIWESSSHRALLDRGKLVVAEKSSPSTALPFPLTIPVAGRYRVDDLRVLSVSTIAATSGFTPSKSPALATLDAAKVRFPLVLRHVGRGDRFRPFGMSGTMLLSDFMTNRKLDRFQKEQQLVVEDAEGTIVWVVGMQTSELCRVANDTKNVLQLELRVEN